LEDAPPLFGSATAVPRAGVLLALAVLVASGVFACAQNIYDNLGPAFYGLRTSLLTLLLMALWRIKRPEGLKEYSPQDLGRVLGLDRAPEVKTLRRKLARLAAVGRTVPFGQALAQQRVALRGAALGFLYADGHVRVYHGQHALPKAHVARMRISLPATSDYWVNDSAGDPLFVITAPANAGLVKMLPGILDQVRALATDDPDFFLDLLELIAALDASIVDDESLVDGAKAVLDKLQARRGAAENRTELRRQLLAHTLQQIRLKTLRTPIATLTLAEARLIVRVRIVISKGYTRRFKRSRFSRAFFSSRSLAHLTMMANRKKNETIKKIGLVTSSSSK